MPLKTPSFWYDSAAPVWKSLCLQPAAFLYDMGRCVHQTLVKPYQSRIPVICVGNLTIGGSGKTPAALALMELIKQEGLAQNPVFLTRGYGGSLKGPVRVDPAVHKVMDVGDEPLLLARSAQTIVAADRAAGARQAEQEGADLIVMDDGLQNPSLHKTVRFVSIDGAAGFGNGHLLPAGPLREPLEAGLKKADAFIMNGEDRAGIRDLLPAGIPVFTTRLAVSERWEKDSDRPYIAFAGLARPEKFFTVLGAEGVTLAARHAFPDHHPYTASDLAMLAADARAQNACLITTEKDAVRLPAGFIQEQAVDVLSVQALWDDPQALEGFLRNIILT